MSNTANPDLLDDSFFQNPWPVYAWLRENDPVHWSMQHQAWLVTRFADVYAILRDPQRFSNAGRQLKMLEQLPPESRESTKAIREFYKEGGMINADPPEHTRLRRLVGKAFTPNAMEALRPRVQVLIDQMLDEIEPRGSVEVNRELASPLPAMMIAEILGAPEKDRPRFGPWADQISAFLSTPDLTVEVVLEAQSAILQMREFFLDLLKRRKAENARDVLTMLAAADTDGDYLTEQQILATCQNILLGGRSTTMELIGSTVATLLHNPGVYAEVLAEPALVTNLIDESLRFDSPLQGARRVARADLEFQGKKITASQTVILCVGSANHDSAQFENPDQFDLHRPLQGSKHIAFGTGIHFCIGAPLAWVEAEVVLNTMLQRLPGMKLAPDAKLRWDRSLMRRALLDLPVTFTAKK